MHRIIKKKTKTESTGALLEAIEARKEAVRLRWLNDRVVDPVAQPTVIPRHAGVRRAVRSRSAKKQSD